MNNQQTWTEEIKSQKTLFSINFKEVILVNLLIFILAFISFLSIKTYNITDDSEENFRISYNLIETGIYSIDGNKSTDLREPIPNIINAIYLKCFIKIPENENISTILKNSNYIKKILFINIIYVLMILFSVWLLSYKLIKSFLYSCCIVLLSWFCFLQHDMYLNHLLTELPASLFLLLFVLSSLYLFEKRNLLYAIITGFLFGILCLTKSSYFYVSIVSIPIYIMVYFFQKGALQKNGLKISIYLVLSFLFTLSPWILRNYLVLNKMELSSRGDTVLLTRAVKNTMTNEEYKGSFYVYAPVSFQKTIFDKLGYNENDLLPGGKYCRLIRHQPGDEENVIYGDPSLVTSYWEKAKAISIGIDRKNKKIIDQYGKNKSEASKNLIFKNFDQHIYMVLPFSWRGIWSFSGRSYFLIMLFDLLCFLCFFTVPLMAIKNKNSTLFIFSLFSIGIFVFHALFSHFLWRYSAPLIPITIISFMVIFRPFLDYLYLRINKYKHFNWTKF